MEIKPYHKLFLFGSIGLLIAFLQRERLKKGYRYVKDKFDDLLASFAEEWVGVKEIGDNQSFANQVFQSMMKKVGWQSSDAWCMYFAKAVHYEVFKQYRDRINALLNGSTQRSFNNAKNDSSGTYTTTSTPAKGDIAIWQRTDDPSKGHAAIVVKVNTNGTINTIEGNTDGFGTSEGDGVYRKTRPSAVGTLAGTGSKLKLRGYIHKI